VKRGGSAEEIEKLISKCVKKGALNLSDEQINDCVSALKSQTPELKKKLRKIKTEVKTKRTFGNRINQKFSIRDNIEKKIFRNFNFLNDLKDVLRNNTSTLPPPRRTLRRTRTRRIPPTETPIIPVLRNPSIGSFNSNELLIDLEDLPPPTGMMPPPTGMIHSPTGSLPLPTDMRHSPTDYLTPEYTPGTISPRNNNNSLVLPDVPKTPIPLLTPEYSTKPTGRSPKTGRRTSSPFSGLSKSTQKTIRNLSSIERRVNNQSRKAQRKYNKAKSKFNNQLRQANNAFNYMSNRLGNITSRNVNNNEVNALMAEVGNEVRLERLYGKKK